VILCEGSGICNAIDNLSQIVAVVIHLRSKGSAIQRRHIRIPDLLREQEQIGLRFQCDFQGSVRCGVSASIAGNEHGHQRHGNMSCKSCSVLCIPFPFCAIPFNAPLLILPCSAFHLQILLQPSVQFIQCLRCFSSSCPILFSVSVAKQEAAGKQFHLMHYTTPTRGKNAAMPPVVEPSMSFRK